MKEVFWHGSVKFNVYFGRNIKVESNNLCLLFIHISWNNLTRKSLIILIIFANKTLVKRRINVVETFFGILIAHSIGISFPKQTWHVSNLTES